MSLAVEKRTGLWESAGRRRGVGIALGIFALTRLGQLLMLAWLGASARDGLGLRDRLLVWDAQWFLRVAVHGYPEGYSYDALGRLEGNELAFFPVYPMLVRALHVVGVPATDSAIALGWISSACAAVAVYLLGTTLHSRRAGWALVAICCSAPASVVFSMAYSEGVFLALVAGMLVAAHRKVWWAAGLLGLAASLTRPTGAAAAVALTVAAIICVRETSWRNWQPPAAAAVALSGVPLYLAWVGWRVGDLDAWFRIQSAGWGTSFDFGASVFTFLGAALTTGDQWVPVSVAVILLVALAATGVALSGRPWLPLAVYGVISIVLVFGQAGYYHSKPRLLVPVLLTLLPAAVAAARARPRVAVAAIAAWGAFGLWYGAYLIVVWPYTL